jgi:EF-P beta-lysylation protein EpmB
MSAEWKKVIRDSFKRLEPLLDFLEFDLEKRARCLSQPRFPLLVPKRLAAKMEKNNPDDPLFLQFVPTTHENILHAGYSLDPVDDQAFNKSPTLLHKYAHRVLMLTTSACAMHCRYCFRQNFPYATEENKDFENDLALIAQDTSLYEVILSGGDPLSLSDEKLHALFLRLGQLPHVKVIRIHTRFPIGIPERITAGLLDIFKTSRQQVIFVIHSNHASEWDDDSVAAMKKIQALGIPVLCQTVLLKGVNDHPDRLKELIFQLIRHGMMPYYLHQLDRVQGAAHFEVDEARGHAIIETLRTCVPGYGLFRYVAEIPHRPSKTPLVTSAASSGCPG